jgi:SulP family sulfate permease
MASVFSGLWVLVAMLAFAPLAKFIPKAALASVLIVTAYSMVDRKEMKRIWQSSRGDSFIMVATLLATLLLPLEFAVLSGMIVSFGRYIITTSTPDVSPVVPDENYQLMKPQEGALPCLQMGVISIGGSLYFGATQHVEDKIYDNLQAHPEQRFLLLRMSQVDHMDISGIHMLEAVVRKYRSRGGDIFFSGLRESIKERMKTGGFDALMGEGHYLDTRDAISHIFHKVLDPSVCIYECDRRVFAECQALPKYPYGISPDTPIEIPDHLVNHWLPSQVRGYIDLSEGVDNPILVDVREKSEFDVGHIPKTILIPLRKMREEGVNLPSERPVILICRSGRRSSLAAIILQDLGYSKIYNMKGGMLAWEAAGYPVAVE